MNALVTGGGGFIGSALIRDLIRTGYDVTSFSRGDYPELRRKGAKTIIGDVTDINSALKATENIDIIFHVAAKAGLAGSYKQYYETNVTGTENILKACKLNKIKYLIYTSSASVVFDGDDIKGANESMPYPARPLSYYTATKAIAEQMVLQANSLQLSTIALRPHLVYGPGDNHLLPRIIERSKSGKLRRIGNGKNLIDVSYIDNVTAAHINAAMTIINNPAASGNAYFITNGEPVLLWDFLDKMLVLSGCEPVRKAIPVNIAFFISLLVESFYKVFPGMGEPLLTRFLVRELSCSHWFDISKARRILNYNPEISNTEGLKRLTEPI
jgi:nucleoside-diphosphate-sugar epimerase